MDSLDKRPKAGKMDMRFGMWNVRSLYKAALLITVKEKKNVRFSGSTGGQIEQRWH
jgi:hypothetical protein